MSTTTTTTMPLLHARNASAWRIALPMIPTLRAGWAAAEERAAHKAAEVVLAGAVLDGTRRAATMALVAAGLNRKELAAATRAVRAASTVTDVRRVTDAALRDHQIAARVAATAPQHRWGVACHATRVGDGGIVAHAKRAAAAMRAAGAVAPADPRAALEREQSRLVSRRAAAVPPTVETLASRLSLVTTALPARIAARLDRVEEAFRRAFRSPDNAAQRGHDLTVVAARRGSLSQKAARAWVRYSSRESHQATVVETRCAVGLGALLRPDLLVVDGLLTVEVLGRETVGGCETFAAKWLRQGRGTAVDVSKGFIAALDGLAAHGPTRDAAARTLRTRIARVEAERAEKAAEAAAEGQRAALVAAVEAAAGGSLGGIGAMPSRRIAALAGSLDAPVRLGDSRVAGNCDAGTADWCRLWLGLAPESLASATVSVREVLAAVVRSGGDRATLALAACVAAASR